MSFEKEISWIHEQLVTSKGDGHIARIDQRAYRFFNYLQLFAWKALMPFKNVNCREN